MLVFCLYLCISWIQEATWLKNTDVKSHDVLIMFTLRLSWSSSWHNCSFHQQVLCLSFSPETVGLDSLPLPDTTKELKLHASHKSSDKVRPFGFLHWRMLLWLIENELFIFTALTTESAQMFISSGLGIQLFTDEKFVFSTELKQ